MGQAQWFSYDPYAQEGEGGGIAKQQHAPSSGVMGKCSTFI